MTQALQNNAVSVPRRATAALAALALVGLFAAVGCQPDRGAAEAKAAARSQAQRELSKSSALIKSVTAQLRDLPDAIGLELRPPSVLLDSTSSLDGQDVEAVLGAAPGTPAPPPGVPGFFNYLRVPAGNAGFKRLGVEPGDTIKYFIDIDDDSKRRIEIGEFDSGTLTMVSVDLFVAQVIDENTLRISGGLSQPVTQPAKLEIWRLLDDRMVEINNTLGRYAKYQEKPLSWEPSGDASALVNITERLNQWVRSRRRPEGWAPAGLLATLPPTLAEAKALAPFLSAENLGGARYQERDGRLIQEAIWTRDVARWAAGERFEPVERARSLFDWTVRNVALSDDPRLLSNRPWQTLLYGSGTAAQRAWVFASLCRQEKLPVVVLTATPEASQNGATPWLVCGLLDSGSLRLFDPQLGLPIRAADGESVATLTQATGDNALLRRLDLPDSPYPLTAESLAGATCGVVADSFSLAWRAEQLQRQFNAGEGLTLWVDADAIAREAAALPAIDKAELWATPYELLRRRLGLGEKNRTALVQQFLPYAWRPKLWKARVLHLRGVLETEAEAKKRGDALYDPVDDHRAAGRLYMTPSVRPQNTLLEQVAPLKRRIYIQAKADATYWLGLLQFEEAAYKSSREWLERALGAVIAGGNQSGPANRRAEAIRYNLARALEAEGSLVQAAELLETSGSPQRHGDRLRAQRLREQASAARDDTARDDAVRDNTAAEPAA